MRKHKTIKIDDKEITVKELIVRDVLELFKIEDGTPFIKIVDRFLPRTTTLTRDELRDMAPSEIKAVVEAWKEVNQDFFGMADLIGMGDVVTELVQAVKKDFVRLFFQQLSSGTATSGTTDGASL
jgi:Tfp pilus assembly PilM family ATPase